VGVKPDVVAAKESALAKAHVLALEAISARAQDPERQQRLAQVLGAARATLGEHEAKR
jgi:DNA-binding XRE family transcriptional regulator